MPALNNSLHAAAEDGDSDALNQFLANGENVDARDPEGRTPLMYAIHGEQINAVRHLLKWGAAIDREGPNTRTPLHLAASEGNAEIVRLLLARGAVPNQVVHPKAKPITPEKAASLIELWRKSDEVTGESTTPKTVEELVAESLIPPAPYRKGSETLMSAISSGSLETVTALLEAGIDTGPREPRRLFGTDKKTSPMSCLHWAVSQGTPEIVRTLVRHGVDVNGTDRDMGVTPLESAVMRDDLSMVRVLLKAGADVEAGTVGSLQFAIFRDNQEMVELLLEFGAKVTGPTVLFASDKPEIRVALERHLGTDWHRAIDADDWEAVRASLDAGAPVDARTENGETGLHLVAEQGRTEIARLLIERGADVNATDEWQGTPLMNAARKGHAAIARLLIEAGADVNATSKFGINALYTLRSDEKREIRELLLAAGARVGLIEAAVLGDARRVRMLLESGVPVDTRNAVGMTALMAAARHNDVELATFLYETWGADVNARDDHGQTPLFYAAGSVDAPEGDTALLQKLLDGGAEIDAECKRGTTPLERSFNADNVSRMTFLIAQGADPNHLARRGSEGKLAIPLLHQAILTASVKPDARAVRVLLDHGADVNAPECFDDRPGNTPLEKALEYAGQKKDFGEVKGEDRPEVMLPIIRLLIERGADLHPKAHFPSKGILSAAIATGSVAIVTVILDAGATWDGHGADVLLCARQYPEISAFLREHGATETDAEGNPRIPPAFFQPFATTKSGLPDISTDKIRGEMATRQRQRWSAAATSKD